MKKLIAFAIAAVMVLSMIPVMTFGASAAAEGDWTTYRDPNQYEVAEDKGEPYRPAPGYSYTAEGFTTTENSADYTGTTPKFTVQTTAPQSLKAGVYMKVRVDNYVHENVDAWLSFNLSDRPMVENGGTKHGNNWTSLIRHAPHLHAQSFLTTMNTDTVPGEFKHIGSTDITPEIEEGTGKEIYTFEVIWDDAQSAYQIKICGVPVAGCEIPEGSTEIRKDITTGLDSFDVGDQFYVGFTLHSGAKDSAGDITILEYGNSVDDFDIPSGSDSKEAEDNLFFYGDTIDKNTVAANTPALLFDADLSSSYREPKTSNMVMTAQGDKSYKVSAAAGQPSCYYLWDIMYNLSYNLEDFPVFTMLVKDYYGADGGLYFCAGDVVTANDSYRVDWAAEEYYGEDDEYTLVQVDLSGKLNGRIHSMRPDFVLEPADPTQYEWTICYTGMFRSAEESKAYAEAYLADKGVNTTVTDDATTTDPVDPDNDAATTEPVDNADTKAEDTKATETKAETKPATDDKKNDDKKGGCGSTITMGAVAILAAAAAAVALKKKD